jgi:ABC-type transport system substrate-binding protein
MRNMWSVASLVLVLAFVWSSSSPMLPANGAEAIKRGGTLNVAVKEDMLNLSPWIDGGFEGEHVDNQIVDSLVNVDEHGKIVPGLAESWTVSPDGTVYTFRLRRGVKFHDGTDFDASAVKFNWDGMLDPKVGYAAKQYATYIKSYEILDKYTFRVITPGPDVDFLAVLSTDEEVRIHSPAAIRKWGKDYGVKAAVGTGPFKFQEWVPGERTVIVRNENYWKPGLPYLDRIVYRPMPEGSLRTIALRSKRADVVFEPDLSEAVKLRTDRRFSIMTYPGGTLNLIYFNSCKKPFDNLEVRQALYYGIDRKAIAQTVFLGYAEPASGIFPRWHWAYDPSWEQTVYPYDPQRAKKMLEEAGFDERHPLEFTLHTTNVSEYVDEAQIVQNQLAKIGVKVNVQIVEKAALASIQFPPAGQDPTFDAGIYRLKYGNKTSRYTWAAYAADAPFQLTWYNRACGYKNPEMPPLIEKSRITLDRAEAIRINRRISEIAIHDAPRINLSYAQNVNIIQSYVKGMGMDVLNWFPLKTVWLDK